MSPLLRAGVAVLAAVVGAVVGLVTTFAHAQSPPWVLLGGLLLVAGYVLGVRLAFEDPIATSAGALGVLAPVGYVLLVQGDAVVIGDDALGIAWIVAVPTVIAAAAAWPIRRRPEPGSESP
ncbi:hypothetical protein [Protaetiibacter mangrovi]|uniref:Histidinol dehydrogenase n=1 Tax=Protaetiibacter mangrovi TaxID=2970926 RepID=A0ABT1ZE68_9MICO|nr:hypothetical protein [Protaetiibacter mangrovi]MCS0498995.1 hypothetical protein [Protaetiibacter mangrovi]TPX04260.1 hypothetical protein FJ656_12800 [Schumannella luteola]